MKTEDFGIEILAPLGEVYGVTTVNKFGFNEDIDSNSTPEDIWDGSAIWTEPTTARLHDITSSSALDTAAGTGARTVLLEGLDENWEAATEVIPLSGVATVSSTTTFVIIHRMMVQTAGSGGANAGQITATAQVDGTVTAQISTGANQTLMAIYGIAAGKTGLLTNYYTSVGRDGIASDAFCDIVLSTKNNADLAGSVFTLKHRLTLQASGTAATQRDFKPYLVIPEKSIIKLSCVNVSDNNTIVSAGFDLYIVDNADRL